MKACDWVLSQPWAITEESLATILAIAERRNESPEAVEAKLGRPLDNSNMVTVRDGVAVIPVVGPIARYADLFTEISGATAIDTLAKDFRTALDDRSIKGIVLNMDSPGGTVSGVAEFAGHVAAARGTKPVVCYVGSRSQSAGYWIASAADRVVADPTAMLGSIGVVMGMRAKSGSANTVEFVSSQSPYKRVDPTTETGKAHVQATIDDLADVFVDAVACNRGVTREKVLADFGQGGSMVGAKAVAAGMADSIGSLEGVIASLSKGEMPWPPAIKPTRKDPAVKAESQPRRAAMSEPNEDTISAAEAADLRKQLADMKAKAAESDAVGVRLSALEEANQQLKAQNKRLEDSRISSEAKIFAESQVREGKAAVTERDSIASLYIQAANDDSAMPIANPRVEALKATFAARVAPPSFRTVNERVEAPASGGGFTVFSNDGGELDPKVPSPARQAELLKLAGLKA